MNEQERTELDALKRRHTRLEEDLSLLSRQLQLLETRLTRPQTSSQHSAPSISPSQTQPVQPTAPLPEAPIHIPKPPPIPLPPPVIRIPPPPQIARKPTELQPRPVQFERTEDKVGDKVAEGAGGEPAGLAMQAIAPEPTGMQEAVEPTSPPVPPPLRHHAGPPPASAATPQPAPAGKSKERSFEMRLGTFWLVRIGIVMLVTGFVFFANYAYKNYVINFGPGGKLALLYVASFGLLGAGAWWQRKPVKESLKNYAEVLFAGGLAAVYFTTYAAHHLAAVRVIGSAVLDGALLLVWAAVMVGIANWKKSEVMALFTVLLAYYAAVITHVGLFTLYSNLVLTLAAVFFLVRNRWAILSFTSLAASYSSYGFWRFFNGSEWYWPTPEQGLWTGAYFLIAYWIIFSTAVFLSRHEKFKAENRASFLTLNNGGFFTMFLLTMIQLHHGGFWKFALVYGAVLLGLAVLARKALANEPLAKNTYLTQGLLLATTGIISHPKLGGLNLAFVLGVESVTLLMAGQMRTNLVLLVGGYLAAALGVAWCMDGMLVNEHAGSWRGAALGGLMLWNALWVERDVRSIKSVARPQVSYFTLLALAVFFAATYNNTSRSNFPLVLAGEAALLVFSVYLLQVREITLFSLLYLGVAQTIWVFEACTGVLTETWFAPSLMLVLSSGISVWVQKQKVLAVPDAPDSLWPLLKAVPQIGKLAVFVGAAWFAIGLTGGLEPIRVRQFTSHGFWLPVWLGALMMADVFLSRASAAKTESSFRFEPASSTTLALLVWLAVTWHHTSEQNFPLALAIEGLALTLSFYLLRVREITFLAQGYVVLAHLVWVGTYAVAAHPLPPWWNSALLIAITLGLSHWWQKQKSLPINPDSRLVWQGAYALALVALIYYWWSQRVGAPAWLAVSGLCAVLFTAYAAITRTWLLAAFGQIFVLVSCAQFVFQLGQGKPEWYFPLVPILALALLTYSTVKWFESQPDANAQIRAPSLQIVTAYRWAALVMSLWWVYKYIPEREQIWVFALAGLAVFFWSGWRKSREGLVFGGVFTLAGLALLWWRFTDRSIVYWPNVLAVLALLGQQRIIKLLPAGYALDRRIQGAMIITGGLSLWLLLSHWVQQISHGHANEGSYLTASWCVLALALFTAGIGLRERVYRWVGLGILACAFGRVVLIDVWKLETIYRVLSFMALGVVLLVLGFIYTKYEEKIKEWL